MTIHSETALFRVTDNSATSPVILHSPHGGRAIPAEYLYSYVISPAELEAEKDIMTDHFTDVLVESVTGASAVINGLSRFAVDVERFPGDSEEMNAVGMGVLYTHGSRRQLIRRVTAGDREPLLAYFAEYSARFTALVDVTLALHGRAVIIDVHSYPEHELPYELHGGGFRAPLCVGSDPFHASAALLGAVAESFSGLETRANTPFAGAYVPLTHYQTDARVSSVMLEIRRDVYLNEATLELKPTGFASLQESLQALVDRLHF
ncbi:MULTISPECIES: N-formylglutamate amidohydrolase [unclassified Cryobacterium]|uniref:N-formylglutamate amidohydrolase n=2 Tax=Bacteria TaxID=2 RepID=UPI002AB52FA9|nr:MULTISPECIES: N-formylglutamate amidohydrolase [unclassified Cryobacterium]MDY7528709.1 N-formylglutamate amidohydrolase [Cryobacterium sp. 10C2]MDY7555549.1 N-formylglutamate amidohydrolase [Cryobacterium sp. 10C3]MEB0203503.1 N-formylglutamate amidohydrolase [Cryobacterium sp. 5I3]MEB0287124.1 N-formylglutamate amidohydrolase [Cryobacterium sp. 10S3]MEB0292244.1 N-formylglutamate amidohydrolase [Cryobacterium sp. 10C2]